jgi:succinate-semialdehyde dehydrogenase / glutarate-semialdehyde dehydrogenase
MKFSHFELGSNDAFIVLDDAKIDEAVEAAYKSRMLNSGQAVINAKRFIVHEKVYDEFRTKLV